MTESFLFDMWYRNRHRTVKILLLPLSFLYFAIWTLRDAIFSLFPGRSLGCRCVSVGNVTVGGTGKTPFTIFLMRHYSETESMKVAVLTRGYRGETHGVVTDEPGFADEARLMKQSVPAADVISGADRLRRYEEYRQRAGTPDVVILDDGFQHRAIRRDRDIVMIDGSLLFGNGFLFPAGPLREPVSAIRRRASLIVVKDGAPNTLQKLRAQFPGIPVFGFNAVGVTFANAAGEKVEAELLRRGRLAAFCGIANPASFRNSLRMAAVDPALFESLGDHARYDADVVSRLLGLGADGYVTTAKDAVKVRSLWPVSVPLFVAVPEYLIEDGWREFAA